MNDASSVEYAPKDQSRWSKPTPTEVDAALDEIKDQLPATGGWTDNAVLRADGTGAIQDSTWILATGIATGTGSVGLIGATGASGGDPGSAATLRGGAATDNADGGAVSVLGGAGHGTGDGQNVLLQGGAAGASGSPGVIDVASNFGTFEPFDAKGDILAGTANDAVSRLAVGTNGQVLTADSAEATGLKYATPTTAAHAASHTDGTDDIQNATAAQKGLATAAQITKLDGIEAAADVTDATNVNAAGATMNTDSTLAGNTYFLDEDTLSSDSATKVASQQSIKAYIDKQTARKIVEVTKTTTQSVNSGTWSLVQHNVTTTDAESWWSGASSYRITPDVEGYFLVWGCAVLVSPADGTTIIVAMRKNGSVHRLFSRMIVGASGWSGGGGTVMVYCNGSTDYFDHVIYHNHGSARSIVTTTGYNHFGCVYMGNH